MEIREILDNKIVISTGAFIAGIVGTWITQQILNKRGVFSYSVFHNRVGISADDAVFGSVKITLNGNEMPNLYLSVIEIRNESSKDYEDVEMRVWSNDTVLLSEQTQIDETSYRLELTDKYKKEFHSSEPQEVTEYQRELLGKRREYVVPVFNRGQIIKLTYLNSAKVNTMPTIQVDAVKKGVKLVFRPPLNKLLGESQSHAALVGIIIGCLGAAILIANETKLWQAVWIAFIYGVLVVVPGAYFIKLYRKLREIVGG